MQPGDVEVRCDNSNQSHTPPPNENEEIEAIKQRNNESVTKELDTPTCSAGTTAVVVD